MGTILGPKYIPYSYMEPLMKWSFSVLLEGKWPARHWQGSRYLRRSPEARKAGSSLCDGYYGVLVQLAGDFDYLAKWLEVPRWSGHLSPEGRCTAHQPFSHLLEPTAQKAVAVLWVRIAEIAIMFITSGMYYR